MGIELFDANSSARLGEINEDQLRFLIAHLEEEDLQDQDYYISQSTLSYFESSGVDPELLAMLTSALGDNESIDVRWRQR